MSSLADRKRICGGNRDASWKASRRSSGFLGKGSISLESHCLIPSPQRPALHPSPVS